MKRDTENRREFFRRGARYLALGGMAVYAGGQAMRTANLEGDPRCIRLHPCAECAELGGCGQPKAEAFRKGEGA